MNDSVALLDLKKKAQKQLYKISEETSVNSGRAKALLLLSEGATQEEAAEKTALSLGQIRYWLGRYRAKKEKKDKPKKAKKADKKAKDKPKKSEKNKKKSKKTKSK